MRSLTAMKNAGLSAKCFLQADGPSLVTSRATSCAKVFTSSSAVLDWPRPYAHARTVRRNAYRVIRMDAMITVFLELDVVFPGHARHAHRAGETPANRSSDRTQYSRQSRSRADGAGVSARARTSADRRRTGRGKDYAGAVAGAGRPRRIPPAAVHQRHAAFGRAGRDRLQRAHGSVRVQAGPGVSRTFCWPTRSTAPRRRRSRRCSKP